MSNNQSSDYGLLISPDIKLHRAYFKEMTRLHGIKTMYKYPIDGTQLDVRGDVVNKYSSENEVWCILQEYPDQKTLKKMGWAAEFNDGNCIMHVPYDLEHLQVGCLFTLPSAIEGAPARQFRVVQLSSIMIYPASFAVEVGVEYINIDEPILHEKDTGDGENLLIEIEGDD